MDTSKAVTCSLFINISNKAILLFCLDEVRQDLVRTKPRGMIVNRRGHDEFVHVGLFDEPVQTVAHRFGRTNE